jgi:hypothetical protein
MIKSSIMAANNFKPDYRIAKLSMFGIVGLIFGCAVLFFNEMIGQSHSIWHELTYNPKELTSRLLTPRVDSLQVEIKCRLDTIKKTEATAGKKNAALIKARKTQLLAENKEDAALAEKLTAYLKYCSNVTDADTVCFARLNHALHFNINADTLNVWNDRYLNGHKKFEASYTILDTSVPLHVNGQATFDITTYRSDIGFLTKYPAVGIWVLLLLIFCSFSFIAISTSIYLKDKTVTLFKDNGIQLSPGEYYKVVAGTLITLVLLWGLWKWSFYDEEVIKALYYMKSWKISLRLMMALGYIAGAFCLAGFIYKAAMLAIL